MPSTVALQLHARTWARLGRATPRTVASSGERNYIESWAASSMASGTRSARTTPATVGGAGQRLDGRGGHAIGAAAH